MATPNAGRDAAPLAETALRTVSAKSGPGAIDHDGRDDEEGEHSLEPTGQRISSATASDARGGHVRGSTTRSGRGGAG